MRISACSLEIFAFIGVIFQKLCGPEVSRKIFIVRALQFRCQSAIEKQRFRNIQYIHRSLFDRAVVFKKTWCPAT
ncbi:hypothetical protein BC938DRAFT_472652 [Jimgerdemannia flammicorona]|uniref:Uncharacterized protein n=1 Tax=Jimgerdemannia flammicorona TaxID=994334 RepID=A0A433QTT0_9FUNG|nr:hypothetical protein BC938DRAFT_472652 [Jimgerdemannia flammicorona]